LCRAVKISVRGDFEGGARLRCSDVIVGFRDQPVRSNDDLLNLLYESVIERDVTLKAMRGSKELSLTVRSRVQFEEQ
jgi:S1-C subfamily serine protease